jgi:hypothetical protein
MTAESLLTAAHRYRELGFSVIPFRPHGKSPDPDALAASGNFLRPGQPSWEVFNARQATDEELDVWFSDNERNLGLVSGYNDLLILDFDTPASWQSWSSTYEDIARRTCIQKTRKGYHVLLRWTGVWIVQLYVNPRFQLLSARGVAAGELNGSHDCVVAWPSIHPSGQQYEWLPGQAPWETEIMKIGGLREIGIAPRRNLVGTYVRMFGSVLLHPRQQGPAVWGWLQNKYRFRRCMVFH